LNDSVGEFLGGTGTADISSSNITGLDGFIDGRRDSVGMFIQTQVSQHHNTAEKLGSRVSRVLVLNIKTNVTTSLKEII
jgi:hypothetical protein